MLNTALQIPTAKTPEPLAACPFCSGPPVLFVRHHPSCEPYHAEGFAGLTIPLCLDAYVYCHECGVETPPITEDVICAIEYQALLRSARQAWNVRDERHGDLYTSALLQGLTMLPIFEAEEPQRDGQGFWTHSAYFSPSGGYEFGRPGEYDTWLNESGLESITETMPENFWSDIEGCNGWDPHIDRPDGDGWFIGSIHDTEEEGPVCIWLRKVPEIQYADHQIAVPGEA